MSAPHIVMIAALILGSIAFAMAAGAAFGPVGMIMFVLGVVGVAALVVWGSVGALLALAGNTGVWIFVAVGAVVVMTR